MSTERPQIISDSNLSVAWARLFLRTFQQSKRELTPFLLSVDGFAANVPNEDAAIRKLLDEELQRHGKNPADVSAMTIFPYKPWVRRGRPSSEAFCELCTKRLLPRLKKRDRRNQNGTYFARMMASEGIRRGETRVVNQVQFVINLLNNRKRWPRQSALQLACFDPAKDHTGQPVRGFPCLQQVSIAHDHQHSIAVNAYYPTQYIFERAYGNYLGLCHLGHFIAHESGLEFVRLNCFIGRPELGDISKRQLASFAKSISTRLAQIGPKADA